MRLAFPWALLLLLPVLKMVADHFRKTSGAALRFSSLAAFKQGPQTTRQRFIPLLFWLQTLALVLLVVALARPQRPDMTKGIPKEGIAIELVVDVSSSMDISMPFKDTTMSRMEVTKQVVEQFVGGGENLDGRPNDLIGLISFARYADTVCPLTLSHDSLLYYIHELKIESRPNEDGTAFGDALALAAARLQTAEERYAAENGKDTGYSIKSKVIILLTDGNNNCGHHLPMEGAALAEHWGIRVHTIAITDPPEMKTVQTPEGPIQIEAEPLVQERILQKIAETTGGIYRRATNEASLRDVYGEINAMEKSEIETQRYHTYTDIFQPFAATALLLLVIHTLLATTWLRRIP
ncbi:MAG: VWA domain-containing protein [Kiritimatiellales bacterium]|nr:VWA domain-containing protein [Kiritimatiellales bacterium]MCF7864758.1 VWA domain-containing protein [Kiritimatiellales bacterium]